MNNTSRNKSSIIIFKIAISASRNNFVYTMWFIPWGTGKVRFYKILKCKRLADIDNVLLNEECEECLVAIFDIEDLTWVVI